jgi:MFS family permease
LTIGRPSSPAFVVTTVCVAEIAGMTPLAMFLALQPLLQPQWSLSNTMSGWISSSYYAGYMLAVPVLASLTDRFDARTVWLSATALGGAAAIGFGLLASGVWTAALFQALAGASLAGTYMPGLKLMDDRIPGPLHPRQVAFYTTSFTLGSSGSYFAVGKLAELFDWRVAIVLIALGPVAAWLTIALALPRVPPSHDDAYDSGGRWLEVVRSGDSIRYVIGYACHMWELFGLRAWLIPFFAFCVALHGPPIFAPPTLAAIVALVGMPASFLGAELTTRFDRRRLIITVMLLSAATGAAFGWLTLQPWTLIIAGAVVYHALIMGDSAALTAGLVAVSPPQSRGTAMALYSMAGFAAASAGSFATGALLDAMGGQSVRSWSVAFVVVSASNLLGALVLMRRYPTAAGENHR